MQASSLQNETYNIWKKECLAIKTMFAAWHQHLEKPGIQVMACTSHHNWEDLRWPVTLKAPGLLTFTNYCFQDPLYPECPKLWADVLYPKLKIPFCSSKLNSPACDIHKFLL